MVTRYVDPEKGLNLLEHAQGEYVRYEDYQRLVEALRPFADKWLYPDDLGAEFLEDMDEDDLDGERQDECWIKRAWIRAARLALL